MNGQRKTASSPTSDHTGKLVVSSWQVHRCAEISAVTGSTENTHRTATYAWNSYVSRDLDYVPAPVGDVPRST